MPTACAAGCVVTICDAPLGGSRRSNRAARPQWARLGSNQRPLACEASALPLSYAPGAKVTIPRRPMKNGGTCPRRAAVHAGPKPHVTQVFHVACGDRNRFCGRRRSRLRPLGCAPPDPEDTMLASMQDFITSLVDWLPQALQHIAELAVYFVLLTILM